MASLTKTDCVNAFFRVLVFVMLFGVTTSLALPPLPSPDLPYWNVTFYEHRDYEGRWISYQELPVPIPALTCKDLPGDFQYTVSALKWKNTSGKIGGIKVMDCALLLYPTANCEGDYFRKYTTSTDVDFLDVYNDMAVSIAVECTLDLSE